jgi:hypothetical protein
MFKVYLQLGFEHISDLSAYDHILFITVLCAIYRLSQWKHILILVTAFTLGHTLTLALSALQIVNISSQLIEFLIPVTIFATAIFNVTIADSNKSKGIYQYMLTLFFGLIHGLGFSNYFRSLLGNEESITLPLFAFNLGVELGQLLIVGVLLGLNAIFLNVLSVPQKSWNLFVSGMGAGISLILMAETYPPF